MSAHQFTLTINGVHQRVQAPSNMTLLTLLREQIGLISVKNGCSTGECGACTVIMNGEPVNACLVLAVEADGSDIITLEGLAPDPDTLHPLQEAFITHTGTQCGFCTPGVLMSAYALLSRKPHPTDDEIKDALRGNLCRCTGYLRIVEAVKDASQTGV